MKAKNLIILGSMALGAALLVAAVAHSTVAPAAETQTAILVASRDLPAGTEIARDDFEAASWPEGAVPIGAIRDGQAPLADYEGARLRRAVLTGEPLLESRLVAAGGAGFLAGSLGEGKRAVSIPVKAETSVAGFVRPGDMVDVLLTYEVDSRSYRGRSPGRRIVAEHASETVLHRVRVLAVDQKIEDVDTDARPGNTVTLEVDPAQAEKLALAREMGELSLSLRGLAAGTERPQGLFTADLEVGHALRAVTALENGIESASPPSGMETAAAPPRAAPSVRVYHGAVMQSVPVPDR